MSIGRQGFTGSSKAAQAQPPTQNYNILHRYTVADSLKDPVSGKIVKWVDSGTRGLDSDPLTVATSQAIPDPTDPRVVKLQDAYFVYTFQNYAGRGPLSSNHVFYTWIKNLTPAYFLTTLYYIGARVFHQSVLLPTPSNEILIADRVALSPQTYTLDFGAYNNTTINSPNIDSATLALMQPNTYCLVGISYHANSITLIDSQGTVLADGTSVPWYSNPATQSQSMFDSLYTIQAWYTNSGYIQSGQPISLAEVAVVKYNNIPTASDYISYYNATKGTYGL